MQWVKSSDRLPKKAGSYYTLERHIADFSRKDCIKSTRHFVGKSWSLGFEGGDIHFQVIEWLDESEPSFTLQNMIDAYEEGEQESCNAHTGSKSAHVGRLKWFLDNFNIDLNKHK